MNEARACDRSAGSLISSGPSSLGALINLARERRQMLAGWLVCRAQRTDACGAGCLKIYRDTRQKEQATTRFLCMREQREETCNIQPPRPVLNI
jgi:hypothetical protein